MTNMIMLCSPTPRMGKGTVAGILKDRLGYKELALADPIKELAKHFFNVDDKDKEKARGYYIKIGQGFRELDNNVWCREADKMIAWHGVFENGFIISDLRILNEQEYFAKRYNVITIGIESNVRGDQRYKDDDTQKDYYKLHKDYVVKNNGSIEDLESQINIILDEMKGGKDE